MEQNYPNYKCCGRGRGRSSLEKRIQIFFGHWLLLCHFIEISNQMDVIGEVSNFEKKFFIYVIAYYIIF